MAENAPSTHQLEQGIAAGSVGFGVLAAVLPRVFNGIYGLGSDPRTKVLTRLWGTRTAALGALWFLSDDRSSRRTLITVATAMNVVDAALVVTAGEVPLRSRVLGSASSGSFAAAGAYTLAQG